MEPYIYTVRKNIHIIDLEQTEELLKKAADFLFETAAQGGQIIFVGTKRQASELIKKEAERCGALHVTQRWLGGTITNYRVIKKNIDKLVEYMRKREVGEFDKYTKKERLLLDREIDKLQASVGGLIGLSGKPAAVFVIDAKREKTAVREAIRYNIPVVALIDTNSDPTGIKYVIPGNDDAIKSIVLVLKCLADAVKEGYEEYAKGGKKVEAEVKTDKKAESAPEKINEKEKA